MAIVIEANTAREMRIEVVKYLEYVKQLEQQKFQTQPNTFANKALKLSNQQLIESIIKDFAEATIQQKHPS